MATRLPVRTAGGRASTHPSSNARSTIATSIALIVRVVVDAEHARPLARSGTETAGELRKIVRRVQTLAGRVPPIAIDEVVPVGNQIAERAPLMTEWHAAIHAARGLIGERGLGIGKIDLTPVVNPFGDRPRRRLLPRDFNETRDLTHVPWPRRPRRHEGTKKS